MPAYGDPWTEEEERYFQDAADKKKYGFLKSRVIRIFKGMIKVNVKKKSDGYLFNVKIPTRKEALEFLLPFDRISTEDE